MKLVKRALSEVKTLRPYAICTYVVQQIADGSVTTSDSHLEFELIHGGMPTNMCMNAQIQIYTTCMTRYRKYRVFAILTMQPHANYLTNSQRIINVIHQPAPAPLRSSGT